MKSAPKNPMHAVSRLVTDLNRRQKHVTQFVRLLSAHTHVYERMRAQSTDTSVRKYDPFIDGYINFLQTTLPTEHQRWLAEFKAHIKREEFDKESSLVLYYMKKYPLSGKWLSFLSYVENNKLTKDITPEMRPSFQLYASRFEDFLMYDLHDKACPLSGIGLVCKFMENMPTIDPTLSESANSILNIQLICTYLNERWGPDYVAFVLEEISAVTMEDGGYLSTEKTILRGKEKKDWESWDAVCKQLLNCFIRNESLSKPEQEIDFQEKWHKLDFAIPYKELKSALENEEASAWLSEAISQSNRDLKIVPIEHRKQLQNLPDTSNFYLGSFKTLIYTDESKAVDNTTKAKDVNYKSYCTVVKNFGFDLLSDHDITLSGLALRKDASQSIINSFDTADGIINPQKMKTSAFIESIPDKRNLEEYFHRYFETDKIIDIFEGHIKRQISFMRNQAARQVQYLTPKNSYGASIPPKDKTPLQDIAYVFKHKRANLKAAYFAAAVIACREIAEEGKQIDADAFPVFTFFFWSHSSMTFLEDLNDRLKKSNTIIQDPDLMPSLHDMAAYYYVSKYTKHVEQHFSVVSELFELISKEAKKAA